MSETKRKKCCKLFLLEWHYSKLGFFHHDWKAFVYTPWLPYRWHLQLFYVAYRWLIALYFNIWLVLSGVSSSPIYLVYLTNWAFVAYNAYLIVAAVTVTTKYIIVHWISKPPEEEFTHNFEVRRKAPKGCCGFFENKISWYQIVQWIFYLIGTEMAFTVLLLYWSLLYRSGTIDGVNANTHLVNGICAIIDVWLSGIPVNTLHVVYVIIFGSVYVIFSGLYFVGSGNNIYSVLDYENAIGQAIALCVLVVLILGPAIHFIVFYSQYKLKELILYHIFKRKLEKKMKIEEAVAV